MESLVVGGKKYKLETFQQIGSALVQLNGLERKVKQAKRTLQDEIAKKIEGKSAEFKTGDGDKYVAIKIPDRATPMYNASELYKKLGDITILNCMTVNKTLLKSYLKINNISESDIEETMAYTTKRGYVRVQRAKEE